MALVVDSQMRPVLPLRRGSLVWIHAHLLAALKPLIKEADLDEADRVDLIRSSSTASPFTPKNPRPCIIWDLENERGGMVEVLLAGTYDCTTYTNLPLGLKKWVIGLFNESATEDWMTIEHVHASPGWRKKATSWIIPFPVTVPTSALQYDAYCKYINDASMEKLASLHNAMRVRYDLVLSQSPRRKNVARNLLDYSGIKNIMNKESPLYDAPFAIAGPSRHPPGQLITSSMRAEPAFGDMQPPQKRRRHEGSEARERSYGVERGGRGATGRSGRSASSRRGASRSRSHGPYHQSASGSATSSLNRNSAGHRSTTSLSSHSSDVSQVSRVSRVSQVSQVSRVSQASQASHASSKYFTAQSEASSPDIRTRNVSGVSIESAVWNGSGDLNGARERRESGALERGGSSVRADKRKRSPPATPATPTPPPTHAPWPQTPAPPGVTHLNHHLPERPSFAFPSPPPLRLTLPEAPQKPLAPPETPRKKRATAEVPGLVLASLKKLSPPSLKGFGRRHSSSKENAETPTRERGDPLSPQELGLRRTSRANSLCSSSRPNSAPSSPKSIKVAASALKSPLAKVAHLLRVGGAAHGSRSGSREPPEDDRNQSVL